ncbi:hypothetical protein G4G31_08800 [Massilia sp. Se16.2.3]|nr:hypothetical protein G4G31_08800 [Massilia sp. Se16.2.3]
MTAEISAPIKYLAGLLLDGKGYAHDHPFLDEKSHPLGPTSNLLPFGYLAIMIPAFIVVF